MASTLTSGQVPAIYKGETLQEPVFQIINLRELPPKEGQPKRYRLLISDGTYFMQSMLTTQLNNLVADGKIQPNTTVRLLEYVINDFQSKKLVIVLRAEVVG